MALAQGKCDNYRGNFPGPKEPAEPVGFAPSIEEMRGIVQSVVLNDPGRFLMKPEPTQFTARRFLDDDKVCDIALGQAEGDKLTNDLDLFGQVFEQVMQSPWFEELQETALSFFEDDCLIKLEERCPGCRVALECPRC